MDSFNVDYPPYGSFKVVASSDLMLWREKTFHTKEPTAIQWIQSLEKDSILIDVGANVGIYTIPASLFHVKKVIAIEPEIEVYTKLLKNIEANAVEVSVDALPLAVSTVFANSSNNFDLTRDEPGISRHQVVCSHDHELQSVQENIKKRSIYSNTSFAELKDNGDNN